LSKGVFEKRSKFQDKKIENYGRHASKSVFAAFKKRLKGYY